MAQSNQSAQAEKSIAQDKAKKRHTGTVSIPASQLIRMNLSGSS
ncbi:hypothetical protein BBM1454_07740 [Bifidobacterium breve MCC 1454]|nr:hypothetical protein BBM1094_07770 [Bifidobacterium breve MCC 1094]KOA54614.1 hypothetical protein BBM1454_07740 [Bifidobacterium breve MCC 1454]